MRMAVKHRSITGAPSLPFWHGLGAKDTISDQRKPPADPGQSDLGRAGERVPREPGQQGQSECPVAQAVCVDTVQYSKAPCKGGRGKWDQAAGQGPCVAKP